MRIDSNVDAQPGIENPTQSESIRLPLLCFSVLCLFAIPLFVCLPLTADTALYDLQARNVLQGGIAYQDILEPNLPGAIWVHMLIRSGFGDSSEILRAFDLLVLGLIAGLLVSWMRTERVRWSNCIYALVAMVLFYVSMSEWCHCQRDTWMLLPVLLAARMRWNQAGRLANRQQHLFLHGWLEGLVWGVAFWLKPYIAFPAAACLLVVVAQRRGWRQHTIDILGVLVGGVTAGTIGVHWLIHNGAMPAFYEQLSQWNPEYFGIGRQRWSLLRLQAMWQRFFPWLLVHFVAVPVAIQSLRKSEAEAASIQTRLVAAMYLGWLLQSFLLQHLLDYIHVPAILLAIATIALHRAPHVVWKPVVCGFLLLAIVASPFTTPRKAACWVQCVTQGSTPQVRSVLSETMYPDWEAMDAVVGFLRENNVQDGEVTCYNAFTVYFYNEMELRPSTRYVYLSTLIGLFPSREAEIQSAVDRSNHRFVITERLESGIPEDLSILEAEQATNRFPWSHPVVFKAGRYLVHELKTIPGKIGPL